TRHSRYQIITHASMLAKLYQQVSRATQNTPAQGLILALLFGDRSLISTEQWQALRNSGLSHLVAISGLHIGIVFGFGFLLGQLFSRFHTSLLWAPWWLGLSMASSYAWLAGFTLPTLRALLMCLTMVAILRLRLQVSTFWRLSFILTSVLIVDPFASYSNSFWLSFGAVIVILYLLKRPGFPVRWWWQVLWLQMGISLLMLPISIALFHGISYVSLFFNLVFIPWFSYLAMPLLFIALMWLVFNLPGQQLLWQLSESALSPVLGILNTAPAGWLAVSDAIMWLVIGGGILWRCRDFIALRGITAIALIVSLVCIYQPKRYQWRLDILDVGHGLAILIEQGSRALVFDTGASWQGGSIAKSVILPMLAKRGLQLETIMISHMDNDHAGGVSQLLDENPDAQVYASQSMNGGQPCIRGMNWWWGTLHFEALWPPKLVSRAYNQHSCVIRVRDMYGHAVLLTGDVEAIGEWLLVRNQPDLTSQVMVVPHHGSATSSTQQLIDRVAPKWALASVNKGNRWRLPSQEVVKRYQQSDARWLDTGSAGQISVFFEANDLKIKTKRLDDNQRWYRQMLRNGLE
ncbi:MAG: DNA internalization-related competence protein ComEC/Rec2, partial [Vibrio sp.]